MDSHEELTRLADRYWDTRLEMSPTAATMLGDHRFDDRIEDLSRAADDRYLSAYRSLLGEVEALDPAGLGAQDRITRLLLHTELSGTIDRLSWRPMEMASDQMMGVHAELLTVAPQISAREPEHAAALVQRHRKIGTMLDQAVDRFRDGLAAGRAPAAITITRALNQLDGYLNSDLSGDAFVTLEGPADWDGEESWRAELAQVAAEVIRPGFRRYRAALAEELLPAARPDDRAGLCWLGEDGADIYRRLLHEHTTLPDLGAEEIHRTGLAELESLRAEYAEIGARRLGTADPAEIFTRLREDRELRYRDGDEIMADARGALAAATAEMKNWFGRLPRAGCDIVPVPEYLEADSATAYYFPPPADNSRPGTYFVNRHQPTEQLRYETASVAYHEAIPGHHLQLAIANELDHLPRFQRQSFANTAFVEGWALYAERLADEMGLYADDLDRLGMLAGDSWRSCRLVVDTGIHAMGWSRQQAVDFMIANAPVGENHIRVEVDRYIAMPGQAVAYKVGQIEIRSRRTELEQRRGDAFDLKAFHDVVLGSGSVSLPVLRELVATL
ncbi:DUF885 domain-containing protein [Nocardia sp. NPDC050435]|uniref:DUF885 domain-containing protein n=1 Tax=Nocardia sp. NPDC050435 TaxID=3155040 RepID=UPI0034114655